MPGGPVNYQTFASAAIDDSVFHAGQINPALLTAGPNLLAVEIHQANLTSSDVSLDLELRPNVSPTPPAVVLTAPANTATFFGPLDVALNATATDLDDSIASVEFYDGATPVGADTTDPYSVIASNLVIGPHVLRAVATDDMGLSTTSAPVNITVLRPAVVTTLIPTGAVWKYLDTGVDQATAWRAPGFDDSGWFIGTAKFGTNDPARTIIHITPINVNVTAYFRNYFSVSNAASYTNLAFRVLRDDGVVAYLNGTEIFRMNMPPGTVFFSTFASTGIGGTNENYYVPTNINAGLLLEGINVLAVELHQAMNTSDAGFDLGLVGIATPASGPPPVHIEYMEMPNPAVILSWPGSGLILQESDTIDGTFIDLMGATSPYTVAPAGVSKFYRLKAAP
jgi:hypothetical protein